MRADLLLQDERQFPAEILSIPQATIHALTPKRRHHMSRIPKQKDPALGETCSDGSMKGVDCLPHDVGRRLCHCRWSTLLDQGCNCCLMKQIFLTLSWQQHKLPASATMWCGNGHCW